MAKRVVRFTFRPVECKEVESCNALRGVESLEPMWREVITRAEYSPESITEYCAHNGHGKDITNIKLKQGSALKVKMHLSFMGWKIESKRDRWCVRTRYVSPDGKSYYSLRKACMDLKDQQSICDHLGFKFGAPLAVTFLPDPTSLAREQQGSEGNFSPPCRRNQAIGPTKSGGLAVPDLGDVVFERECFPEAVIKYTQYGSSKRKHGQAGLNEDINQVRLKAKKHLSYEGWRFWYVPKKGRRELRYGSPDGKTFPSLLTACKEWMERGSAKSDAVISMGDISATMGYEGLSIHKERMDCVNTTTFPESVDCVQLLDRQIGRDSTQTSCLSQLRELGFGRLQLRGVRKRQKRINYDGTSVAPLVPQSQLNACFPSSSLIQVESSRQEGLAVKMLCNRKIKDPRDCSTDSRKLKMRKASRALITQGDKADRSHSARVLRSSTRVAQVVASVTSRYTVRTVLSWLMDNDVLLPRQKVCYKHENYHRVMAEGRVSREGIKCKCCEKVYSLIGFGSHAGSTNLRPAANIFLEDGRSLLQCQMEILRGRKLKDVRLDAHERTKRDYSHCKSDDICSLCHYGGELLLCDYCPSSFHLTCVGLKDVPKGKWSCPSCRCGICGHEFNADSKQFTMQTARYCDQCERKYHVGCLRRKRGASLQSRPQGKWFCNKKCSMIFAGLQELLRKPNRIALRGLSWTILKSWGEKSPYFSTFDNEAMVEDHSKLWVAVGVLHECFLAVTEARTQRDLATDVVFNRRSELNRLNFSGFYTMLLERGDELISVATVRIYGEKAAEVPLICTRVPYRRQGMCRLLMNELELMLTRLGVERLLLPAVPSLLKTWTTSFGFTKMTSSDRLKFLDHTFLQFPETTICQKLLKSSTRRAL
ncbi:uncharacterized protein LOC131253321 [Magnolia sinica]|uniref:uncharacterized protein LOC131253321 n=1 Tax=Magnolia sinica TaxID=86752 RepID=UPI00265900D7|nr:uncharacterized protein LOC131253321 [Magnolia sinica]XP_058110265.1 uncharacterized protein LOC131253321 [Magnolia sinica]XP_058110266.1 uncharacterized protein LOC131253321 [Magnolia sinica]